MFPPSPPSPLCVGVSLPHRYVHQPRPTARALSPISTGLAGAGARLPLRSRAYAALPQAHNAMAAELGVGIGWTHAECAAPMFFDML
jgi:hypothetical protein